MCATLRPGREHGRADRFANTLALQRFSLRPLMRIYRRRPFRCRTRVHATDPANPAARRAILALPSAFSNPYSDRAPSVPRPRVETETANGTARRSMRAARTSSDEVAAMRVGAGHPPDQNLTLCIRICVSGIVNNAGREDKASPDVLGGAKWRIFCVQQREQ